MSHFLAVVFFFDVFTSAPHAANKRVAKADAEMAAGEAAFARGSFDEAIVRWPKAGRSFERADEVNGQLDVLLRQAAACHALGQHKLALQTLGAAEELARGSGDRRRRAEI